MANPRVPLWPTLLAWLLIANGISLLILPWCRMGGNAHDLPLVGRLLDNLPEAAVNPLILTGWLMIPAAALVEYGAAFCWLSPMPRRRKLILAGAIAVLGLAIGIWLGLLTGLTTWLCVSACTAWYLAGTTALATTTATPTPSRKRWYALVTLLVPLLPATALVYWYATVIWDLPPLIPWYLFGNDDYSLFGVADTAVVALVVGLLAGTWYSYRRHRLRRNPSP